LVAAAAVPVSAGGDPRSFSAWDDPTFQKKIQDEAIEQSLSIIAERNAWVDEVFATAAFGGPVRPLSGVPALATFVLSGTDPEA
jgi:hypothetical protein